MRKFVKILDAYVDPFDKRDKMIIMGYKVGFDSDFLRAAFKRMGGDMAKYGFGSRFVSGCQVDVSSLVGVLVAYHGLRLLNYKLSTVCEHFKIPLDAHDALNDIRATRALYGKIFGILSNRYDEIISGTQKTKAPVGDDVIEDVRPVELITNVFASKTSGQGPAEFVPIEDVIRDKVRETVSTVEKKMRQVSRQGRLF